LRVMDNRLYFLTNNSQLWSSDGSDAGTAAILPGGATTYVNNLSVINGRLFFEGVPTGASHTELFSSDGTMAGTGLVAIGPGTNVYLVSSNATGQAAPGNGAVIVN